ncbi:chlorite dismutase family protein [Variovorax sp. RT4R15]|uniref:chlorite dismutase family protein n=1 Tax=Variovorax sp. RT4R15 TaxID=3443737 RepID=UPI003F46523A
MMPAWTQAEFFSSDAPGEWSSGSQFCFIQALADAMLPPASPRLFHFSAGDVGDWKIANILQIKGESLSIAPRLRMGSPSDTAATAWVLSGATSNERYVTREEKTSLVQKQEGLGRIGSTLAVLIPIKKTDAWWAMTQDERRGVLEAQSRHIEIGLRYLPAVARRLHHCRDLATVQPFDFLTWFEFAPSDASAFSELLGKLRATPEWQFVEREVEVRLEAART